MSKLQDTLSQSWRTIQGSLFSWIAEELDVLTKNRRKRSPVRLVIDSCLWIGE